jgi:hypothetical protein
MTSKRAWLVGVTASLGLVMLAAGIFLYWFYGTWDATDVEPYREAEAIGGAGLVILVIAWALSRKR